MKCTCPKCGTKFEQKAKRPKLNFKQESFVGYYLTNGGNGVKAAESAGYVGDYGQLATTSTRLLNNPKVAERIQELNQPIWPLAIKALREVVDDPTKPSARMRAVEILAKLDGRFIERHEHTVAPAPAALSDDERERLRRIAELPTRQVPHRVVTYSEEGDGERSEGEGTEASSESERGS